MNYVIKGFRKITPYLNEEQIKDMEAGAILYRRHANIQFAIITATDTEIIVQVVQGKHMAKNYLTQKELITRAKDMLRKFLPGHKIHVHATPYEDHFITQINEKWLAKKMFESRTKAKDIAADTGVPKSSISGWVNGTKPMSQTVKAMLYFYFAFKESAPTR